jgi:outer membrane receptor protein involved in Fe transport
MNSHLRVLLALLFFSFTSSIFAGNTGKIAGTVKDKDTGEPLPFANVIVEGTNLGAATDINGYYTILNVPPGVYTVTASVVGYQKQSFTNVRVNVDFTTRLNFELGQGSIKLKAVVVEGERNPLIRQDLTNPQVAITSETISELPVDQISDVVKLTAGVTVGDDGSIHVRGGYGNEIAYTLNGVSLNDPYANHRSIGLATNAVQEVSLSAGTFSAEYGNALSGVVNYVTKEGGNKYTFSFRGYAGDYLSTHKDMFDHIDLIDPLNRGRMEATFGGPVPFTNRKLKLFVSGVFENFKGSFYGVRLYNPSDSYLSREGFRKEDPRHGLSTDPYFFRPYDPNSTGIPTGDGKIVPMNPFRSYNLQANLSYNLSSLIKLKYEVVYNQGKSQYFSRSYMFNPDGRGTNYSDGMIQTLGLTHTINDKMFYTLKTSYGYNEGKYYLYKDVDDPRYLPTLYRRTIGNTMYLTGGTDNHRFARKTKTMTIKGDFDGQLLEHHEIKFGFEARFHDIWVESYNVQVRKADGSNLITDDLLYDSTLQILRYKPDPKEEPSLITTYRKYPVDGAAYIQDKIELAKTLILNIGLRYEYFDPKAYYNPNLSKDLQDIKFGFITRSLEKAKPKQHISPRISFSFPISDKGVIRFSYGHFYQNGSLASLYRNHNFYVTNVGSTPSFGNPNVNMQKSVQYEMGLQQQLTENFKMDLTAYYKDVRDYIYTQTVYTATGRQYSVLTNLAYSNVRGITLSFYKRRAPGSLLNARLDYTFQIAEGNRTYPSDELFYSEVSGKQSETYLVPLGFDRQHVINATLGLMQPGDWSLGMIANFQTGTPYTPILPSSIPHTITYTQNSARQPVQWNVDLKFEKFFKSGNVNYSFFVQVLNLFDTENERYVYASTGRALQAVEETSDATRFLDIRKRIERHDPGLFGIDIINGYYSHRPERLSRPREVRVGFSVIFN